MVRLQPRGARTMGKSSDAVVVVTDVSTGLRRAFTEAALAEGHQVIGTVRTEEARASFEALAKGRAHGRILEMTSTEAITPFVSEVQRDFGRIDVLVNNAGYGHEGAGVTCIEPGGFRTDWAGRSLVRSERRIKDYDAVMDPIRATRRARHGNQVGDPAKAGRAMLAILGEENPPAHLVLGTDALALCSARGPAQIERGLAHLSEPSLDPDSPDAAAERVSRRARMVRLLPRGSRLRRAGRRRGAPFSAPVERLVHDYRLARIGEAFWKEHHERSGSYQEPSYGIRPLARALARPARRRLSGGGDRRRLRVDRVRGGGAQGGRRGRGERLRRHCRPRLRARSVL
ncbi:SDR family NAD(P)-dependent oxidoreductase [Sorangium sp. So ce590]|uniref:SDR family NAD(P)-dependent oxidoreductase n=1 Tax=Sorangium sp. So ce590 TaxID=3133317 RepID=UPI003F62F2E5